MAVGEADDLAGDRPADRGFDGQTRADRHGVDRPGDLDHQPAHADHAAIDLDAVDIDDLFGEGFHALQSRKISVERTVNPPLGLPV